MINPARWSWRALLIAGVVVYGLTAFFSEGYYHLDEHFQLLEFANYKLGATPPDDLPWEFHDQIRPALQPLVAVAVIRTLRALGSTSPFTAAMVLRLLSGLLGLFAVAMFTRRFSNDAADESSGKRLLILAIALWFMPYLAVRFSSENWSAIALLLGLSLLPEESAATPRRSLRFAVMGLLLGLSFVFRFQMGFALVGVMAWLLARRQLTISTAASLVGGGILGVLIGTGADFSFYGDVVFTPWRYFVSNIVHGKAAEFGTAPPWFYLPAFVVAALPPISIALLVLAAIGVRQKSRHLITWLFVAFVVGHSLVAHKELRFLFPMAVPFLWLVLAGWDQWRARHPAATAIGIGWRLCIGINGLALAWVCTRPAQQLLPAWRFLYGEGRNRYVVLYAEQRSPYDMDRLKPHFYRSENVEVRVVPSFIALGAGDSLTPRGGDFLLQRHLAPDPALAGYQFERVFRAFPDWLLRFNVADWESRTEIWSIYRITRPP